jgi:hypothetical protein
MNIDKLNISRKNTMKNVVLPITAAAMLCILPAKAALIKSGD